MNSKDIKLIIIGDSSTGKTSFVNRWISGKFQESYKATIGQNYNYKIYKINESIYRIQIWDIGGQDRSRCLAKYFVKGCNGALIFCDIKEKNTLNNTILWKESLKDLPKEFNYPVILIQSKIDLVDKNELNDSEKYLENFSKENNFDLFFRISSKSGEGIDNAMNNIIKEVDFRFNDENINLEKKRIVEGSFHLKNNNVSVNKDKKENNFNDNNNNLNQELDNDFDDRNDERKKNCC